MCNFETRRFFLKLLTSLTLITIIYGCASSTITRKYPPVSESDVKVWFAGRPDCPIEEIGFISIPFTFGQSMMMSALKKEGAAIGATHVIVSSVNTNRSFEYNGGAIAARCR
jgi:hypothetical protein